MPTVHYPQVMHLVLNVALGVSIISAAHPCHAADGNELYAIGAIHKGLGGAGVASPQDATWALLNPATLVDLERRIDLSFEILYNRVGSQPHGHPLATNPWAGELFTENFVPIPTLALAWPGNQGSFGFGIIGIEGNVAEFPRPRTTLSLLTNGDRRSKYQVAKIPLSYGYRFDNGWAVGGALVGAVTRFRTDSVTTAFQTTQGGNEWDWALGGGVAIGVYKQWDRWSAGACYTSRTWMQDYDRYKSDLMRWNFNLPQKFQAGIAFRPTDRTEILLDYKWIDWSTVPILGRKTIQGGLGWDNQHFVKAGMSWHVNDRWTVRGGVSWGETAISDQTVFANALTPALAELHLATGFSYRVSERATIHAAVTYALPEERTESGQGDIYSVLGRGTKIRYQENALTVQYSLAF